MNRPKKVRDWRGNYVKSTFPLRNSLGEMPAGTIYKVKEAGHVVYLESIPCGTCGLKFSISIGGKDKFNSFEFLGKELPSADA